MTPISAIEVFEQARFDTEAQLLGALMTYQDAIYYRAAAAIVSPEHFGDAFNHSLFVLIGNGIDAGLSGFKLAAWLMAELRDSKTLHELGMTPSAIIGKYIAQACPSIGIEGCARQIKHDYLRIMLQQSVEAGNTDIAETTAAEMERLSRAHLVKDQGVESIGVVSERLLDNLNTAYQRGEIVKDFAYCGSHGLAENIGGWRQNRLYIIAGRPGMGKSTLCLSLLLRTAAKHTDGVLMFSLEMGREELTEMALCDLSWSNKHRIEYRDISSSMVLKEGFATKFETVLQMAPVLNSMPFTIADRGGITIADIRSQSLQHAQYLRERGKRLGVICVDHLGLIKASGKYAGNKVAETEEISAALKGLAKELGCAVVALAQLNRGVEGRDDKRPNLSDLRWSGAIEQDADVVMFVYREAYYLRNAVDDKEKEMERIEKLRAVKNDMELIIAKNRTGPCETIRLFTDIGCAVVRDKEVHHG